MHGPDLHSAQHQRTVHWMAKAVVHQLHGFWEGFWEGFWQRLPRKSMAHTQGIWNSTTDRPCHQELLQQLQVQSGKQRIQLRCEDRCKTRMSYVVCCSSAWWLTGWCGKQHWTDHGASDGPSSQPLKFCISPMSAGFTHSSAHARENHPFQDVCTTNRPKDQPEKDRNDDAEYVKPLAGQSEWRRASNNWRPR